MKNIDTLADGSLFSFWEKENHYERTLYVDCNAKADGDGSKEHPFNTIQKAADIATPGTKVLIASGVYRECVDWLKVLFALTPPWGHLFRNAAPFPPTGNGIQNIKDMDVDYKGKVTKVYDELGTERIRLQRRNWMIWQEKRLTGRNVLT